MDLVKIAAEQIDVAARVISEQAAELDRLRAIEARAREVADQHIPDSVELTDVQIARYILGEA